MVPTRTVRKVPLSANKTAAEMLLGRLLTKIEHEWAGVIDPFEAHRGRPIEEHLAGWEKHLRSKDSTPKHVRTKLAAARRVIGGCGFEKLADLSASRVEEFLAELRAPAACPELEPGKEWYTKAELAAALGVKREAVTPLVKRHRLAATGCGRARRYPRATAATLLHSRTATRTPQPGGREHAVGAAVRRGQFGLRLAPVKPRFGPGG